MPAELARRPELAAPPSGVWRWGGRGSVDKWSGHLFVAWWGPLGAQIGWADQPLGAGALGRGRQGSQITLRPDRPAGGPGAGRARRGACARASLHSVREVVKYFPLQRNDMAGLAGVWGLRVTPSVVAFLGHDPVVLSTW